MTENKPMSESSPQWAWMAEGQPVQSRLEVEPFDAQAAARPTIDAAVLIALRLHLQGVPEEALRVLSMADHDQDGLLLKGQILFEMERLEEAGAAYEKLAQLHPDHPFASFNRGICMARLSNWEGAAQSLQRAVVLDPDLAKAWFALGVCLLNQNFAIDAKACFSKAVKLSAEYVPALFGLAVSLQAEGKHAEAMDIYVRLLEQQPKGQELLNNALASAIETGDPRAGGLAVRLMEVAPQSPAAMFALFSAAAEEGRFDEAEKWCRQLAETNPASFEDRYNLGVCYQQLRRHQDAAGSFETALTINPDDALAMEGLAQSLSELNQTAKSKDLWRRLTELAPEREDLWLRLGLLHYGAGETAEAVKAFEKCTRINENSLYGWVNLGITTSDSSVAAGAFKKALELDPQNIPAKRALAASAIQSGDVDSASRYHEGLPSDHWDITYNLAVLRQTQGSFDSAVGLYRNVLAVKPDFAEAWLNLGNVLFALGDTEQGTACWKSALQEKPALAIDFLAPVMA